MITPSLHGHESISKSLQTTERTLLYENDELPHRAKLVYIYLYDRRDVVGKAWPSVKRMAKDLSISEKTVRRAVQDLIKAGLIRKEYAYRPNGSHTSNRYYLL